MTPLAQYLEAKKLTQGDFAAALNVDRSTVSRWLGGNPPKRTMMVKIEEATGGDVPVHVWFPKPAQAEAS